MFQSVANVLPRKGRIFCVVIYCLDIFVKEGYNTIYSYVYNTFSGDL